MLTEQAMLAALKTVNDPELHQDLVSLGMVDTVRIDGPRVAVKINLTTPACPLKAQIEAEVRAALLAAGAQEAEVVFGSSVRPPQQMALPGIKYVVAVGSGKGGVGKSTLSANLALALHLEGAQVGLLDADIYGPSLAQMLGTSQEKVGVNQAKQMVPLERYGIKMLSMANIVPPGQAMVWRGPILHGTLTQLVQQSAWGDLDYLIIDMPPGTGDVGLSLSQLTKISGAVVVTTPQPVARIDAERAIDMFKRTQTPLLGVVENMAYLELPDGSRQYLFGQGGGQQLADQYQTPLLGQVPLGADVRQAGDAGIPVVGSAPQSPQAQAFRQIAQRLAAQLSVQGIMMLPMA